MKKPTFYCLNCRSKKYIIITCFIIICLATLSFFTLFITSPQESTNVNSEYSPNQTNVNGDIGIPWVKASDKDKAQYLERILLSVLYPYIKEAVNNYYGEVRQYDAAIISIKPITLEHEIQVQVSTFVGPHNPPYGLDTITLVLDGFNVNVMDFKHKDIDY